MTSYPITPTRTSSARWNAVLSFAALAENAAAEQFALIAVGLTAQGHPEVARRYGELASEEKGHHERVCQAYHEFIPPSASVLKALGGRLATAHTCLVERMAVAHFAYETAALGFFGYLHGHIHELMDDTGWANRLRRLGAGILCEEVAHVKDGKAFVAQFLSGQSQAVRIRVSKSVRLHHALLIRSFQRLLGDDDGANPFIKTMIASCNRHYRGATAEIL